jgi:hypothetical protein
MNLSVVAGLGAGILIGIWGLHSLLGLVPIGGASVGKPAPSAVVTPGASAHYPDSTSAPDAAAPTPARAMVICPRGAVSTSDVATALLVDYLEGAFIGKAPLANYEAQRCASSDPQGSSASCKATFIGRHPVGLDLAYGGAPRCIPYDEVAAFCDLQYLEKDSALCGRAYEDRNERMKELGR